MTTPEELIEKGAHPMFADLLAHLMNLEQPQVSIVGMATGEALPESEVVCRCEDCETGTTNH